MIIDPREDDREDYPEPTTDRPDYDENGEPNE